MNAMDVISGKRSWHVECQDSLAFLRTLPDRCVHVCVTSPPYYALRDYKVDGQIGLEQTPREFIDRLVAVFREMRRVLHDHGTLFVNMGDSYCGGGPHHGGRNLGKNGTNRGSRGATDKVEIPGYKPLDRMGIPHQLAFALRSDGWFWRDEIVWEKLSPMPESLTGWRWTRHRIKVKSERGHRDVKVKECGNHRAVASFKDDRTAAGMALSAEGRSTWTDCPGCPKCEPNDGLILRKGAWRTTRAHEFIFLFTKSDRYFVDQEAVREPVAEATVERDRYSRILDDAGEQFAVRHDLHLGTWNCNNCGRIIEWNDAIHLPTVQEDVCTEVSKHGQDQATEILRNEMLWSIEAAETSQMPDLQERVLSKEQQSQSMFNQVRPDSGVEEGREIQRGDDQSGRLCSDSTATSGAEASVHDGAQDHHGTPPWPETQTERVCSSHQRNPRRQSLAKSHRNDGTKAPHTKKAVRRKVSTPICPHCQGTLTSANVSNAAGRNPRSVQNFKGEPTKAEHYAAFPSSLPAWCLRAGVSAQGVCVECGAPMVRVIDGTKYEPEIVPVGVRRVDNSRGDKTRKLNGKKFDCVHHTLGFRPSCSCNAGTARAVVLDCFAGTGTTLVAALRAGCRAIGCDLSPKYCKIAERRIKGDSPLFNAV